MRRQIWTVLALVLVTQSLEAKAQDVTAYLESSGTHQKPRSNAGLTVQGDRLRVRADVALGAKSAAAPIHALEHRPGGITEVVPNLRSAFTIAKNLNLETGVRVAEWNADSDTTFDTRLRYRKSLGSFFDVFDGSLSRSPDGLTKQSMRLGFHELLGDGAGLASLAITGEAMVEATQSEADGFAGESNDSHRVRIETKVTGLSAFLGADHAVGLRIEKTAGTRSQSASSLTYDQSWTLSPLTKLGLNLQLLRQTYSTADDFDHSLDFTWRSRF